MNVLLLSTYELGRQSFGIASAAAWLERAGARVECQDLAVEGLDGARVSRADLVAIHVPMHTATRLAARLLDRVRELRPQAHLCAFGLYAPLNADYLRKRGADTILGGEFETGLARLVERLRSRDARGPQQEPEVCLARQRFLVPQRRGLPGLERYAQVHAGPGGDVRLAGYTEATRGCKHRCRHCPIVPVYRGEFRVIQREVVLEDIRRQVAAGATHITFGDPDFFNGPGHGLALVEALHRDLPGVSYDVTVKVEHLLRERRRLRVLKDTGCLFVTSAVESVDDRVLGRLGKGHTRADFLELVRLFDEVGLHLNPTFVAFTPWTTREGYLELLEAVAGLGLVDCVAPIQYAIRLLIPSGSLLLELEEVRDIVGDFDAQALCYPWAHPEAAMDRLAERVLATVEAAQRAGEGRRAIFRRVVEAACEVGGRELAEGLRRAALEPRAARATVPWLTEPWYC